MFVSTSQDGLHRALTFRRLWTRSAALSDTLRNRLLWKPGESASLPGHSMQMMPSRDNHMTDEG